MNNTPELLSPAGDLDKMRFGIAYGADAVYMAGTRFGMRAAATNFDDNALREGIATRMRTASSATLQSILCRPTATFRHFRPIWSCCRT